MHLAPLIQDLAVILGASALVSLLFTRIRQPVVLGYLLAGIVLGPYTPPFSLVVDLDGIRVWAELGVIFLMFSLGLEFSFRRLLRVGLTAAVAGPFEAFAMVGLGYLAGRLAGWSGMDSLFLGAILSISSTTIIIKALEELHLKQERFAQLIFGILVVEDLAGILILVALSSFAGGRPVSGLALVAEAAKLFVIAGSWVVGGAWLVRRVVEPVARRASDELLIVLSLSLCLGGVVVSAYLHYSVALGAFIMGSLLAESSQAHRIETLLRSLRDVFAAVFFVSIGMLLDMHELARNWVAVLGVTALTIVGKVVSTALGATLTRQDRATSLRLGFGLAQIGEFSFIIANLGLTLGVMSPRLYSIAVGVSVITTFTTPYLIRLSGAAARRLALPRPGVPA